MDDSQDPMRTRDHESREMLTGTLVRYLFSMGKIQWTAIILVNGEEQSTARSSQWPLGLAGIGERGMDGRWTAYLCD